MELNGPIELTGSCSLFGGSERGVVCLVVCFVVVVSLQYGLSVQVEKKCDISQLSPLSPGESRGVGGVKCVV